MKLVANLFFYHVSIFSRKKSFTLQMNLKQISFLPTRKVLSNRKCRWMLFISSKSLFILCFLWSTGKLLLMKNGYAIKRQIKVNCLPLCIYVMISIQHSLDQFVKCEQDMTKPRRAKITSLKKKSNLAIAIHIHQVYNQHMFGGAANETLHLMSCS